MLMLDKVREFKKGLESKSREELLEIISIQNPDYIEEINLIEDVFRNKLTHLTWSNGQPITERPMTTKELISLIDPPFIFDKAMAREYGYDEKLQRSLHVASDVVLWARQFLQLQPRVYQTLVLRDDNLNRVMRLGRRMGKALDVDTPILTPNGWKTMGELKEGDQVFDEKGKPCNVTFATELMYDRKCYKITFSDGTEIVADEDHQWNVETKNIRKSNSRNKHKKLSMITLTTKDMLNNIKVSKKNESNYSIPVTGAVKFVKDDVYLPVSPYMLGFWLGDGVAVSGVVSVGDQDVHESISNIEADGYHIYKTSGKYEYRVEGLAKTLNQLGLKNNKRIPDKYMKASIHQRFELLKGLMDTDGSCDQNGWCEISCSYPDLADDIYDLIIQLGIKATKQVCESWLNGVRHRDRTRIHFKTTTPVFKLSRKLNNQTIKSSAVRDNRYIVDISPVESRPVKCISVDSPNSLYLAGRECVPTHNTWTMATYLLWYSYTSINGKSIVMAPMKSQVGVIYDTIIEMAQHNDLITEAITRSVASPQYQIDFSNGSTIKLFTTGMKSGSKSDVVRGQEGHLIILDEMDYMGKEDLVAVLPMLQTTSAGQRDKVLIAASTPSGQRNMFWDWNHSEDFSSFWFPTYCNPFWDEKTERRLRASTSDMAFRHEYEADWGEDAAGVYPKKFVDLAFDNEGWEYRPMYGSPQSFYLMGVDWDKYAEDGGVNIVILEYCGKDHPNPDFRNRLRLAYREEMLKDEYLLHKAVDRIVTLNAMFQPRHIYVDKGYGEMQVEYLHKYGQDHPETGLHKTVKSWHFNETIEIPDPYTKMMTKQFLKPFMVENLRFLLEKEEIIFSSDDEDMYLQLISYIVTAVTETGRPKFGSGGAAPDHAHDALILAAFAFTHNYEKLLNPDYAVRATSVSNHAFLPMFVVETGADKAIAEEKWDDSKSAPIYAKRAMSYSSSRRSGNKPIRRKMF